MPADVFTVATPVYTAWAIGAPGSTYLEAMGYPGTATTLNVTPGNKMGGTLDAASLPSAMTITEVQVQANFFKTAVYSGQYRWFVELGGITTYSALYKPNGDSVTVKYSGALARPGGGTWTKTDLETVRFGIEEYGDGPWNGEEGSGGEGRFKNLALLVTYTSGSVPVVNFEGSPTEVLENMSVSFSDLSLNSPTTWAWDFGDTGTSTTQHPVYTYTSQPAPPPNHTVTVTLVVTNTATTSTASLSREDYIAIWKTTDSITADFTVSTTTGDAPLVVSLTDSSTGYVDDWSWDFGDTGTSTSENPTYTYTSAGTYTVTLVAANDYTSDTEVKTDLIVVGDPVPIADFTAAPLTGTRPLTVVFTNSNTANKEVTSYTWNFGDSQTSPLANPTHQYLAAGTYTVTLSMANAYGSDSISKTEFITVVPVTAVASFSVSRTVGWEPMEVRFFDESTGDVLDWYWNFGDSSTSTEANPKHVYHTYGTQTITLVVNSALGTNTSSATAVMTIFSDLSYGRFLDELGWPVLENPEDLPCDAFTEFGGSAEALTLVYDRVCKFLLETGLTQTVTALSSVTTGQYALPTDLIELRRVEVNNLRVESVDPQQADYWDAGWETSTGEVKGFYTNPTTAGLNLFVVPTSAVVTTVSVGYVYAPTRPTVPQSCVSTADPWASFPLPPVFWWIIRYGVLADLLSQEGDMYDGPRAAAAEQQWQVGIELAKALLTERNS